MRVAVIGAGIAGLGAVHVLRRQAGVHTTLYEAGDGYGGDARTVDITLPTPSGPLRWGVDTGFLVFDEGVQPRLGELLAELGVPTASTDLSFSVQAVDGRGRRLEWGSAGLATVFAQRRNLWNWRFWRMLAEVGRFQRLTRALAAPGVDDRRLRQPLGDWLHAQGFNREFRDWYLLPLMAASGPSAQTLARPLAALLRFGGHPGLIGAPGRPRWRTVPGGSRRYVERLVAALPDKRLATPVRAVERSGRGVMVYADHSAESYDHVVFAVPADQALTLLRQPLPEEQRLLGAIRYQRHRVVLHTDASVLPARRDAWAAWNYEHVAGSAVPGGVALHCLLNQLQPLPFAQPVIVTLNPLRPIAPGQVQGEFDYAHPVFDLDAIAAQGALPAVQGQGGVWFCGAWTAQGFHEDGLRSGLAVARRLLRQGATRSAA